MDKEKEKKKKKSSHEKEDSAGDLGGEKVTSKKELRRSKRRPSTNPYYQKGVDTFVDKDGDEQYHDAVQDLFVDQPNAKNSRRKFDPDAPKPAKGIDYQ